MTLNTSDAHAIQVVKPSVGVQILAIIGFTGFAIPVSIIAMDQFGYPGLALAGFLGYQWTRLAGIGSNARLASAVAMLRPQVESQPTSSGNASFDAYRDDLMQRLEQEQQSFEGFLTRLRAAKDKSEFDAFLNDRERRVIEHQNATPA